MRVAVKALGMARSADECPALCVSTTAVSVAARLAYHTVLLQKLWALCYNCTHRVNLRLLEIFDERILPLPSGATLLLISSYVGYDGIFGIL